MTDKYNQPPVNQPSGSDGDLHKAAITLTGAQLLQALNYVSPDHEKFPDLLGSEAAIGYGDGYAGKGYYCWDADYPEEGSILLDAKAPAAQASVSHKLTGDEARRIALSVRTSASDSPSPVEYVAAGYSAALARQAKPPVNAESRAWRERFPQYEYRPQDDCVAMKIQPPVSQPVKCSHCGGTGQTCTGTIDGTPELFDCHHCGGTGDVSGEYPGVACPACDGTGKAPQPAEPEDGEEIMVNAAHDVYTLPLQPSGLSSGPRYVVHVPGPEQPAEQKPAPDVARLVEALECARKDLSDWITSFPEAAHAHTTIVIARIDAALARAKGVLG